MSNRPADPAQPTARRPPWSKHLWLLVPLLAGVFCALPVLDNQFIGDDELLIVNNPYAHDFTHLDQNLTRDFFYTASANSVGYYRPAVKLLFLIEYQLFGARPTGYHAVSLLLHLLVVGLAYLLLLQLQLNHRTVIAALLIFATHPAQAEAVGIIASQSDPLSTAGLLAGLLGFIHWRTNGRHRWLALAMGAQILALAAKETGVLLPPLALCWDLARAPHPLTWRVVRQRLHAVWFLLPLAGYALVRLALGIYPVEGTPVSWLQSVGDASKTMVVLVLRALVPTEWPPYLHADRPAPSLAGLLTWVAPALAVILAASLLIRRWRRWWCPTALLLIPTLLFLPTTWTHAANDPRTLDLSDRWVYLPSLGAGLCWAQFVSLLSLRAGKLGHLVMLAPIALLATVQALDTRLEYSSLRDETTRTLWIGQALRDRGKPSPREQVLVLEADAILADRRRDLARSVAIHARLVQLQPDDFYRRYNMAVALMETGRIDEALYQAWTTLYGVSPDGAVRVPINDTFHRHRADRAYLVGLLLEKQGRRREARRHYDLSLRLNPSHELARVGLSRIGATAPSQR